MATSLGPKLTRILVNLLWHPMNEKKNILMLLQFNNGYQSRPETNKDENNSISHRRDDQFLLKR